MKYIEYIAIGFLSLILLFSYFAEDADIYYKADIVEQANRFANEEQKKEIAHLLTQKMNYYTLQTKLNQITGGFNIKDKASAENVVASFLQTYGN